jgi:hypothetical protein
MSTTDYKAFGYTISKAVLQPGDRPRPIVKKYVFGDWYLADKLFQPNLTKEDYESGNFSYNEITLIVSGRIDVTQIHTMIPVSLTRGYSNIDTNYQLGLLRDEVIEETVFFAFDPFVNIDKVPVLPDVSVLRWEAGSIIEPPVKFFLADGSFSKNGVNYSDVGAYSLTSGNIQVTSDSLGYIFNS